MGDNWNFQEVREVTGTLQEATGDQWKFTGNYGRWQENSNKKRSPLPSLRCAFVDIGRVMFVCSWVNVSELSRKFHSFSNILSRFLHLRTFLPPIGYLDQNQVKSLIPVANCWYLSPIADMMSTCVDLCRHMSIYVKKCRFLWIESILVDIWRYMTKNVDFCAILVDLCQVLAISVEVADGGDLRKWFFWKILLRDTILFLQNRCLKPLFHVDAVSYTHLTLPTKA